MPAVASSEGWGRKDQGRQCAPVGRSGLAEVEPQGLAGALSPPPGTTRASSPRLPDRPLSSHLPPIPGPPSRGPSCGPGAGRAPWRRHGSPGSGLHRISEGLLRQAPPARFRPGPGSRPRVQADRAAPASRAPGKAPLPPPSPAACASNALLPPQSRPPPSAARGCRIRRAAGPGRRRPPSRAAPPCRRDGGNAAGIPRPPERRAAGVPLRSRRARPRPRRRRRVPAAVNPRRRPHWKAAAAGPKAKAAPATGQAVRRYRFRLHGPPARTTTLRTGPRPATPRLIT